MNLPPAQFVPLDPTLLRRFAAGVLEGAGVPTDQASLLADLLVANDLRGVFSHGTQQLAAYVGHFREAA
jgi:LDH2 family malate/lactate/ureidoglycolate dehydrogenase